jgi:tripartite-type tricarboxylate transporter receptor subunit TctC
VHAQSAVESFYHGRPITVIVAAGAGGPFGLRSHILAQFLGRHMPGNPNVIEQFMPGAGGRKAANYLYNAAPKDGGTIGIVFYNTALSYRLEPQGAAFDPLKFNWLGSSDPIYPVAFVWHTAPATTIEAMKKTQVVFGASGLTSPTGIFPLLMNALLGTRIKVVKGYQGVADYMKAAESGEIHGAMSGWDTLESSYADMLRKKQVLPLVQFSLKSHSDIAEVPLLVDLVRDPEAKKIARFMTASSRIGQTAVAPPGVPPERVKALIDGLAATYRDPVAIAAAKKTSVDIEPVSAAQAREAVEIVMSTPAALVEKAKQAIGFDSASHRGAGKGKKKR